MGTPLRLISRASILQCRCLIKKEFGLDLSHTHRPIHNWVRPTLYSLRARKKRELEKFPERAKPPRRSTFSDWNYKAEIYAFGKRLGESFNELALIQAFTDKSQVETERRRREELGLPVEEVQVKDNSELAERGRAVLDRVLRGFLRNEFPKMPEEGIVAVTSKLMSPEVLSYVSSNVGTKDLIQCVEYPPSDETLKTAFEAVVGALEESSGEEKVAKFVVDFVASHLCGKDIHEFWDIGKPWHMLLDLSKPEGKMLEPRLLRESGRNTLLAVFVVGIYDEDKKLLGTGIGETVDIAQEMAARDVLRGIFGTKSPRAPFQFQTTNFPPQMIPHVRGP